jgi:hypothetical protein
MNSAEITQEFVQKVLNYDPVSGALLWLKRQQNDFARSYEFKRWNARYAGKQAGSIAKSKFGISYLRVKLKGKIYEAHRLIWLYMTGDWPPDEIDHRDGDGLNNRWLNLRQATDVQNCQNRRVRVDNALGVKGVYLDRESGRYRAQIQVAGRKVHLGRFDTPDQAGRAYARAARKHFGEFARKE